MPQEFSSWRLSAEVWVQIRASLGRVFVKQSNSETGSSRVLRLNLQYQPTNVTCI